MCLIILGITCESKVGKKRGGIKEDWNIKQICISVTKGYTLFMWILKFKKKFIDYVKNLKTW